MKPGIFLFVLVSLVLSSCNNYWIKKPKGLVPENKMEDMLVELHLADAILVETGGRLKGNLRINSKDFYYSVLKKYNVTDTVFEKSFVYYSCYPKDFEKIYADVLDKISQMQAAYKEKDAQPVDIGNPEPR